MNHLVKRAAGGNQVDPYSSLHLHLLLTHLVRRVRHSQLCSGRCTNTKEDMAGVGKYAGTIVTSENALVDLKREISLQNVCQVFKYIRIFKKILNFFSCKKQNLF